MIKTGALSRRLMIMEWIHYMHHIVCIVPHDQAGLDDQAIKPVSMTKPSSRSRCHECLGRLDTDELVNFSEFLRDDGRSGEIQGDSKIAAVSYVTRQI
jgi:hypothetical protein